MRLENKLCHGWEGPTHARMARFFWLFDISCEKCCMLISEMIFSRTFQALIKNKLYFFLFSNLFFIGVKLRFFSNWMKLISYILVQYNLWCIWFAMNILLSYDLSF